MDPARILQAARQCENLARLAASDGSEAGKSKASGYRHALHIFRVMGGLEIPSVQQLAAADAPAGLLPGFTLAEAT